jgi:hypothetical protein
MCGNCSEMNISIFLEKACVGYAFLLDRLFNVKVLLLFREKWKKVQA